MDVEVPNNLTLLILSHVDFMEYSLIYMNFIFNADAMVIYDLLQGIRVATATEGHM